MITNIINITFKIESLDVAKAFRAFASNYSSGSALTQLRYEGSFWVFEAQGVELGELQAYTKEIERLRLLE